MHKYCEHNEGNLVVPMSKEHLREDVERTSIDMAHWATVNYDISQFLIFQDFRRIFGILHNFISDVLNIRKIHWGVNTSDNKLIVGLGVWILLDITVNICPRKFAKNGGMRTS